MQQKFSVLQFGHNLTVPYNSRLPKKNYDTSLNLNFAFRTVINLFRTAYNDVEINIVSY